MAQKRGGLGRNRTSDYVALGAGDRDMYVIAGILASLGLVFRVFVFRGMR